MLLGLLVFVAIVAAVVWFVASYNHLVALSQRVLQTWANIDALLRQRHDELPKLVEACGEYMKYEQATLDRVLEARSAVFGARHAANAEALGPAETELRGGLGKLFALAEAYPELKANQSFQLLQQRIGALETEIAERRETYNDAVRENNVALEQFPGKIIAGIGGFRTSRPFTFDV